MRVSLSVLSLILAGGIALTGIPSEAKGKAATSGNVTYKPAPEGTMHYGDGVTVHRHSDGSVEVSDPESAPEPLYPDQSRPVVRRVVHKRVTTAHKTATSAKSATTAAKSTTVKKTK